MGYHSVVDVSAGILASDQSDVVGTLTSLIVGGKRRVGLGGAATFRSPYSPRSADQVIMTTYENYA